MGWNLQSDPQIQLFEGKDGLEPGTDALYEAQININDAKQTLKDQLVLNLQNKKHSDCLSLEKFSFQLHTPCLQDCEHSSFHFIHMYISSSCLSQTALDCFSIQAGGQTSLI